MKYKVGDKVRIKNIDWYNENKNKLGNVWTSNGQIPFDKGMSVWCGKIMTISFIGANYYTMVEDLVGYWTDEMIEGLATNPLFNTNVKVQTDDNLIGTVDESWWDEKKCCYMYEVSFDYVDFWQKSFGAYKEHQLKPYYNKNKVVEEETKILASASISDDQCTAACDFSLMNEYKTLTELVKKYVEEAKRVFNKLQEADLEAKTDILQYGYHSDFERLEWEYSDENSIAVRYYDNGYDLYESSTLYIPANILFDDTKIDKWIESEVGKALEKKEEKRKAAEKRQEERERREYERLKEKFGK